MKFKRKTATQRRNSQENERTSSSDEMSTLLGKSHTRKDYGNKLYDENRENVRTYSSSLRENQLRALGLLKEEAPSLHSGSGEARRMIKNPPYKLGRISNEKNKARKEQGLTSFNEEIKKGYHLLCDGGTSCNNPKNFGMAYGSYALFHDGHLLHHCQEVEHGNGSVNFAEVRTLCEAISGMGSNTDTKIVPASSRLKVHGDSKIAITWLSRFITNPHLIIKTTAGSSRLFIDALEQLKGIVDESPLRLSAHWVPREVCVEYLGH